MKYFIFGIIPLNLTVEQFPISQRWKRTLLILLHTNAFQFISKTYFLTHSFGMSKFEKKIFCTQFYLEKSENKYLKFWIHLILQQNYFHVSADKLKINYVISGHVLHLPAAKKINIRVATR